MTKKHTFRLGFDSVETFEQLKELSLEELTLEDVWKARQPEIDSIREAIPALYDQVSFWRKAAEKRGFR